MVEGIPRFNRSTLDVVGISNLVEREILVLQPALADALAINGYTSYNGGLAEVVAALPSKGVIPPPVVGSFARNAIGTLLERLAPTVDPKPYLPYLDAPLRVLGASPVMQGHDYRETAALVRQGAFAVTSKLTEGGIKEVRDTLAKAIEEGTGQQDFINEVVKKLSSEHSPLTEPHLENVFRTNALALYSDGKFKAVEQPLVKSHFPYVGYNATADARVRHEHAELEKLGLNGTNVYNVDDPTFLKFRPPWSYNCRCSWHVMTVEQAAKRGVKEAQQWWDKALEMAKQTKRTPYEMLELTKPASMEYVTPPPFEPDPNFVRP